MERYVILWDNDIGWCEKLQRELTKESVGVLEIDMSEEGIVSGPKSCERLAEKIIENILSRKENALAVILSVTQMTEYIEELVVSQQRKQMLPIRESSILWLEILQEICKKCSLPVLLVAESYEQELAAFEAGAFDYIDRNKDVRICVRRILLCGRKPGSVEDLVEKCDRLLYFDEKKQCIQFAQSKIWLTPKECQVFSLLWKNESEIVTKSELLETVWGEKLPKCHRVIDTIVKQLRSKLKETPYVIQTKYRRGYYIEYLPDEN